MFEKKDKLDIARDFMGEKIYNKIVSTYPKSTQVVMTGQFHKLETDHSYILRRLESCQYNKDSRTTEQYARDLAVAWVVEDYAKILVRKFAGIKVRLGGGDSSREFQAAGKVSTNPDFIMMNNEGEEVGVEFITDYHGYYSRRGFFQLRNQKLTNLIRESKYRKTMIFSMDLKNKTFFLKDVNVLNYVDSISWGKPTKKVFINFDIYKLSKKNLKKVFTNMGKDEIMW